MEKAEAVLLCTATVCVTHIKGGCGQHPQHSTDVDTWGIKLLGFSCLHHLRPQEMVHIQITSVPPTDKLTAVLLWLGFASGLRVA